MGMNVVLQDERGKPLAPAISDERNALPRILAAAGADKFPLLGHLDLYGDTTFNRQQLDAVAQEWSSLMPYARSEDEMSFLRAVRALIERGRGEVHQYMKFIGD
jgi:hypothetical protein